MLIFGTCLALAGGVLAQRFITPNTSPDTSTLPTFRLPDLTGKPHQLSDWKGKVVVLNFWATWCPPCKREIPEFVKLQRQYGGQGLQFVGIAIEDKEPVSEYTDFIDINYPILIGGDSAIELAKRMGNQFGAVPYSVVIDRQGHLVHRQTGEFSSADLIKIIEPLL